MNKKALE